MHGADGAGAARRSNAGDRALLGAIRHGDAAAIAKFIDRMTPVLLDATRREGIAQSERETLVLEFLDDIVLQLMHGPLPASPAGFATTAFRHRLSDFARADAARRRRDIDDCEAVGGEPSVAAACSDYTRRAVHAPDLDEPSGDESVRAVVREFLAQLTADCTEDDRDLLIAVSNRIPLRQCADWMGITYDAAKQRIARLRARLRAGALAQLVTLTPHDRVIVVRLLVRAGVLMVSPFSEVSDD